MSELVANLRSYATKYANDYGYCVASDLDKAAARIEALEVELQVTIKALEESTDRIAALEAALRACVQYHVKAAADNRAIAAVNQNNDLGENSLNHAVDHEIAAEDIGEIVNAALAPEQNK